MLGTYNRLGVTVWAGAYAVIRATRRKIAPHHRNCAAKREERKRFYRMMLRHHQEAQEFCRTFRL